MKHTISSALRLPMVLAALAACLAAGPVLAAEGQGQAGEEWLSQTTQACAGCHGETGVSQTGQFPTIAGQHRDYLLHSLKAYREGARNNAIMAGQVQGMSDAQLKALARFYSQKQSPLHTYQSE